MYDAIVIGARCAGSPTAMLLARKGYKVLLVDRAAPISKPNHQISTHFIHQPGVACLRRWGLEETIIASNCPPITKWCFDIGELNLSGTIPPLKQSDGSSVVEAYCCKRIILDKILAQAAAAETQVEFRENFMVNELIMNGEQVVGIRGSSQGGETVDEYARIVIGADGHSSIVTRYVKPIEYNVKPPFSVAYFTYWSNMPGLGLEIYLRHGKALGTFLTNDGESIVWVIVKNEEMNQFKTNIEENYLKTLGYAPEFKERVLSGKRENRFFGLGNIPSFVRKPYGSGWAIVGDAAFHKDPITGQGITDAFRDSELLVQAIDEGFSGKQSLDTAMAHYEQTRNTKAMPMYELTCQIASLEIAPEMLPLYRALYGNQEETNNFLGTMAGTVAIEEFFAPTNIERIITEAHISVGHNG